LDVYDDDDDDFKPLHNFGKMQLTTQFTGGPNGQMAQPWMFMMMMMMMMMMMILNHFLHNFGKLQLTTQFTGVLRGDNISK
jgi:hypothetical protein